MVKTIKTIKELPANSLDPCLFFVDGSKVENQTLTAADIAFLLAVDNRIPTVLFSLEKEEGDIVKDLLPIQFSRYTDNIAGLATAPEEEWDKAKDGIITLSKAPLFIDDSIEVSVGEMNAMAKIIIFEEKVRVIIIDGIYLLEEENVSQQMRIPSTKTMKCEMDFEKCSVIVDETSMKVKVNSTKKYNTDYGWVVVIYMDLINEGDKAELVWAEFGKPYFQQITKTDEGVKIAKMALSRKPYVADESEALRDILMGLGTM